jgi:hypothetical protein
MAAFFVVFMAKKFFPITMPFRWDWRCGRIYDLILPMVETMGYGRCHSDKAENFIRKSLLPTLSPNPPIINLKPEP